MPPQIVRWSVSRLKPGTNIRSDLGPEKELRPLGKSLRRGQDQPLLILADGTIVDGHRRLAAALLEGIEELDCIVVPPGTTAAECRLIQWRCAMHKKDISAYDKAGAVRDSKADRPSLSNRQLAEEVLDIDPSSVTQYLSLWDCIPEVQEAARAGEIGLSDWYAISKSPDQGKALALALNGSSRSELERETRRQRSGKPAQPAVRLPRIRIPLAGDAATGTVTVAGESIDLDDAEALLKEALKAVRAAREKNLDCKTAQAVWRDVAKAGN